MIAFLVAGTVSDGLERSGILITERISFQLAVENSLDVITI